MRKLIAGFLFLLSASAANAATLVSTASGNINATGTWSVIDTTGTNAYLNSETANTALTTSPVASSTFIPAADTLTAIAVKVASVAASPSGTMTVKLANSTSPGSRECTITVNVADLPAASAATAEGGLVFLACAASPNGTDSYTINPNTSVAAQVNLFSLSGTNWSRALVTNGTQANGPAAGDKFFVNGVLTGAGTHSAFTVTVNTTANINYGNVANTLVDPSVGIGQWGTLAFATTSATNFAMEFAGPVVIYNGGTFTIGTSGTPVPMSASCTDTTTCATLTMNTSVEGDTGITVRNGGTLASAGAARTSGKNVVQTHLNANIASGAQTSLSVIDDSGWLSGDRFALADTDLATGHTEVLTLNGNATSAALPISATLSFSHLGQVLTYTGSNGIAYTFPEQAEIILLTRNVRIQGSGNSTPAYIYCQASSNCHFDWTELKWVSGKTTGQLGLESDTSSAGSFSLTNSSFHDAIHAGIILAATSTSWGGTVASPATVQNVGLYNVCQANLGGPENSAFAIQSATTNLNWVVDHVSILTTLGACNAIFLKSIAGQFTNIAQADGAGGASPIQIQTVAGALHALGNWGPITIHSNAFNGADIQWQANGISGTINGLYTYHAAGSFFSSSNDSITIDPLYTLEGANWGGIGLTAPSNMVFRNGFLAFDSTIRAPILIDEQFENIELDNMELCPGSGVTVTITQSTGQTTGNPFASCGTGTSINPVNDVPVGGQFMAQHILGRNTSFLAPGDASNPGLQGQSFLSPDSYVSTDWGTNHKTFLAYGILTQDSAIEHTASVPSTRLTPQIVRMQGYISNGVSGTPGTVLTVTSTPYPAVSISVNQQLNSAGILAGTTILSAGTGAGGSGTYNINNSQALGTSGSPVTFTVNTPYAVAQRLPSAPLSQGVKVAVKSGQTATVCVYSRKSLNTDTNGITYNGDNQRLIERANPQMGVASDTALATFVAAAGTWEQQCGTTGAAPQDGEFEFVVDSDMTATSNAGGWVNVADWSVSGGAVNPNGSQQFWFNGVPFDTNVPAGGGGGGGNNSNHLYIIP